MAWDATIGWHFLSSDRLVTQPLFDGTRPETRPGMVLHEPRPLKMRRTGMHACKRAIDALSLGNGPIACRVVVWGDLFEQRGVVCGRNRFVMWMLDADRLLRKLILDACERSLSEDIAAHRPIDPRIQRAFDVGKAVFAGEEHDQELITKVGLDAIQVQYESDDIYVRDTARAASSCTSEYPWAALWVSVIDDRAKWMVNELEDRLIEQGDKETSRG